MKVVVVTEYFCCENEICVCHKAYVCLMCILNEMCVCACVRACVRMCVCVCVTSYM